MATSVKRKASETSDQNIAEEHKKRSTQESTTHYGKEENGRNNQIDNVYVMPEEEDDDGSDTSPQDQEIAANNTASRRNGRATATESHNIHIARETAELFKSNIFKLQIDELLEQVKLKENMF